MASGYKNIKTGMEYAMIEDSPKLAMIKETTLKMIAQTLYPNDFGNSWQKVSAQLVTRPIAVFKQANVKIPANTNVPIFPK